MSTIPGPPNPLPPERAAKGPTRKRSEKATADPLRVGRSLEEFLSDPAIQAEIRSREAPAEARSRRKISEADAAAQRVYRFVILTAVVAVVSACSLLCMWIAVVPGYPPETVKWATSILTAIVSGGLGILVGGKVIKAD